jgi:hypothetical protein
MHDRSATWSDIREAFEDKTFGFNLSANVVGGKARLRKLIARGDVRAIKKSEAQNAKCYCNAWDVIRNSYRSDLDKYLYSENFKIDNDENENNRCPLGVQFCADCSCS